MSKVTKALLAFFETLKDFVFHKFQTHFAASFCLYFRRVAKKITKILVVFHVTLQNLFQCAKQFLILNLLYLVYFSTSVHIIPHLPPQKD